MDDIEFVEKETEKRKLVIETRDIHVKAVVIRDKQMFKNLLDKHVGWNMIAMANMIDTKSFQPQLLIHLYNPNPDTKQTELPSINKDALSIDMHRAWWILNLELAIDSRDILGDIEFDKINEKMSRIVKRPSANKTMFEKI